MVVYKMRKRFHPRPWGRGIQVFPGKKKQKQEKQIFKRFLPSAVIFLLLVRSVWTFTPSVELLCDEDLLGTSPRYPPGRLWSVLVLVLTSSTWNSCCVLLLCLLDNAGFAKKKKKKKLKPTTLLSLSPHWLNDKLVSWAAGGSKETQKTLNAPKQTQTLCPSAEFSRLCIFEHRFFSLPSYYMLVVFELS